MPVLICSLYSTDLVLLRAKQEGYPISIKLAITRMQNRGIRISARVISFALKQAGE
ncbi:MULTISPECIES: DUF3368 domain-containing protein [unclassified Microcystis]|uniref:DUF3368 domain-containing protein n=1 Tax=unclassified Microcystis TaxID=2643300 RepID=UPI00338D3D41|nr:DUF3368 domain-containing protein [Microcystis sp. M090S1]